MKIIGLYNNLIFICQFSYPNNMVYPIDTLRKTLTTNKNNILFLEKWESGDVLFILKYKKKYPHGIIQIYNHPKKSMLREFKAAIENTKEFIMENRNNKIDFILED